MRCFIISLILLLGCKNIPSNTFNLHSNHTLRTQPEVYTLVNKTPFWKKNTFWLGVYAGLAASSKTIANEYGSFSPNIAIQFNKAYFNILKLAFVKFKLSYTERIEFVRIVDNIVKGGGK